jgi:hypothetical protein
VRQLHHPDLDQGQRTSVLRRRMLLTRRVFPKIPYLRGRRHTPAAGFIIDPEKEEVIHSTGAGIDSRWWIWHIRLRYGKSLPPFPE